MRKLAVVLVLLFAACSNGGGSEAAPSSTGPTVQQVASVVAAHAPALRAKIEADAGCRTVDCLTAENLYQRWKAIKDEIGATFDGLQAAKPYPAEVDDLAGRTLQKLSDDIHLFADWESCLGSHKLMSDCATEQDSFERAFEGLPGLLDSWKPYGV